MTITTMQVEGFEPALKAMRAPLESFDKSDSEWKIGADDRRIYYMIGQKDRELSIKLQKAGPEHCKHLRMIQVWADITAPFFWWKQADCYRFGVEKISTSTMHKLGSRNLTPEDFAKDCINEEYFKDILAYLNEHINYRMSQDCDNEQKKIVWRSLVELLPEGYMQRRFCMFSYAALRNIVQQRKGHKLDEWADFINWCSSLPHSWMIFE